jgi:anti-sigma factor ChrR (cupin superfamily)
MKPLDRDRLQELAALYASGALDRDEAALVDRLLSDAAFLKAEIAGFANVTASLAEGAVDHKPAPDLRERLLKQIQPASPAAAGQKEFTFVRSSDGEWQGLPVPGAFVKVLSIDSAAGIAVVMGKLEPGTRYPGHRHINSECVYVLTGDLHIGAVRLEAGDFHRAAAGSVHDVNYSEAGCTILSVISMEDLRRVYQGSTA